MSQEPRPTRKLEMRTLWAIHNSAVVEAAALSHLGSYEVPQGHWYVPDLRETYFVEGHDLFPTREEAVTKARAQLFDIIADALQKLKNLP